MHLEDWVVSIASMWLIAHWPNLVPATDKTSDVRPANRRLAAMSLVQSSNATASQHHHKRMGSTAPTAVDQQRSCGATSTAATTRRWCVRERPRAVKERRAAVARLQLSEKRRSCADVRQSGHRARCACTRYQPQDSGLLSVTSTCALLHPAPPGSETLPPLVPCGA